MVAAAATMPRPNHAVHLITTGGRATVTAEIVATARGAKGTGIASVATAKEVSGMATATVVATATATATAKEVIGTEAAKATETAVATAGVTGTIATEKGQCTLTRPSHLLFLTLSDHHAPASRYRR
jgi:hypothetical protein